MLKRKQLNQQRSVNVKKPKARVLIGKPSQSDMSVALQLKEASECLSSNGFPSAAQFVDVTKPEPIRMDLDISMISPATVAAPEAIDAVMETGPEHTLIGVVVKSDAENAIGYTVSVALGAKATKLKLRESELKSCAVVRSAIKQTLGRLRRLKLDIAKACCDEESSIKKIEQFKWSQ